MPERKYYVRCESGCLFESMTKEQILAAISEAVSTGTITDVDTGFITKIKESNGNRALTFWLGTTAEYNAIEQKAENCFYILSDDTSGSDIAKAIEELQKKSERFSPLAQIIITSRGGDIVCVDEYGNKIEVTTRTNNVWTFEVAKYGTYTITGTMENLTDTKTVFVDTVKQYHEEIEYYSDNFADNDWDTIIEVIQNGKTPAAWKVGDRKKISFTATNEKFVQILGINHDEYTDGGKAPFTFGFYESPIVGKRMDASGSLGNWAETEMRKSRIPTLINELPENIKNALRSVKKYTAKGNSDGTIQTTEETMFLISEVERFGTCGNSYEGEGTQYEYYANGNMEYTNLNSSPYAWLRSPTKGATEAKFVVANTNTNKPYSLECSPINPADAYPAFCF